MLLWEDQSARRQSFILIKPGKFTPGQPLELTIGFDKAPQSARLYYRRVNQAERYMTADMNKSGKNFMATIPAEYSNTKYPLEYYFELRESPDNAWLYPGFNDNQTINLIL